MAAQTLQIIATGLGRAQAQGTGTKVAVSDLAAVPADDPRGDIALAVAAASLSILGLESLLGYAITGLAHATRGS